MRGKATSTPIEAVPTGVVQKEWTSVINGRGKKSIVERQMPMLHVTRSPSPTKKQRSASPNKAQHAQFVFSQGDFDPNAGMPSGNEAPKVFLQDYKQRRSVTLDAVLDTRHSEDYETCSGCAAQLDAPLRCTSCFYLPVYCKSCLLESHQQLPFHDIEIRMTEGYWARTTLFQQRFILPIHPGECSGPQESDYTDMTIITSSRICQMTVKWCTCVKDDRADQLLSIRLYPATMTSPKTAFTFEGLDHFLTEHSICKTTAYSFYDKLCHLTNAVDPKSLKDRYRDLLRISRLWMDLQLRLRSGEAHDGLMQEESLALRCFSCWQPGFNISPLEMEQQDIELDRPVLCADGNFHAEKMYMKNPGNDEELRDGRMFAVKRQEYEQHLKARGSDPAEKSQCSNHKAVNRVTAERKAMLEVNGIGAVACARHSFFMPGSVVDFPYGERQASMDYALCGAVARMPGIKSLIFCYDVGCQWWIKFHLRLQNGAPHLKWPSSLKLITAVGKFHLGAHIDDCFAKFSPNFIRGAGQIDGENLEPLWSSLNKISPSTRAMATSFRQETLDWHMNESNWGKMLTICSALLKKHRNAKESTALMSDVYTSLCNTMEADNIRKWKIDEERAMSERGEALKIYDLAIEQGPSQIKLSIKLTREETKRQLKQGSSSLLSEALRIEEQQATLRQFAHNITAKSSVLEVKKLEDRRQVMRTRLRTYNRKLISIGVNNIIQLAGNSSTEAADTTTYLAEELLEEVRQWHDEVISSDDFEDLDELSDDEDVESFVTPDLTTPSEDDEVLAIPEKYTIWMPSHNKDTPPNLQQLELELREAQALDALHSIKVKIGEKSVLIRHVVRRNRDAGQYKKGRAWKEVSASHADLVRAWRTYERARMAIERLPGSKNLGQKFKVIHREDLKEMKDITHANRVSQRNDTLPWFWQMHGDGLSETAWQSEVHRVNFLRAKARMDRWNEELTIVRKEMGWTIRGFMFYARRWKGFKAKASNWPGKRDYAAKQEAMWMGKAQAALTCFAKDGVDFEHILI